MSAISDLEAALERCINEEKTGRRTLSAMVDFLCADSFWTVNEMSDSCKQRLIALAKLMEDKPTPSVPTGWKLVPIEPTEEMTVAGRRAVTVYYAISKDVWGAMLAAAPEVKL